MSKINTAHTCISSPKAGNKVAAPGVCVFVVFFFSHVPRERVRRSQQFAECTSVHLCKTAPLPLCSVYMLYTCSRSLLLCFVAPRGHLTHLITAPAKRAVCIRELLKQQSRRDTAKWDGAQNLCLYTVFRLIIFIFPT